jgi:hypothetical protein
MQWTSDNSIDWHDAAERRLAVRANPSAFTVLALCASKIFAKRDDGLAVTVRIQNPRPMTLAAPKDWCRKRGHRLFVGPSMKRRCESIIPHVWRKQNKSGINVIVVRSKIKAVFVLMHRADDGPITHAPIPCPMHGRDQIILALHHRSRQTIHSFHFLNPLWPYESRRTIARQGSQSNQTNT